jgi:hypothetical protein
MSRADHRYIEDFDQAGGKEVYDNLTGDTLSVCKSK